ncbi:putative URA6-uridine-monophosphate kinase, partial [Lophiostoma macrostomum CBS 122681]
MHEDLQIISVLGPPGSGKGTQCEILRKRFHCAHLSAGDLLRAEAQKENSPWAALIQENIKAGKLGPREMVVGIIKQEINALVEKGIRVFFVDGNPRQLDTARFFEEQIGPIQFFIELKCPDDVLVKRLMWRARADDDESTIQKRIETFKTQTTEVLQAYRECHPVGHRVIGVDATGDMGQVYRNVLGALKARSV